MNKVTSGLVAGALAASCALSVAAPLNAAPVFEPQYGETSLGVQLAAYEQAWKPMKPWIHRDYRSKDDSFYRLGNDYYLNGHRGYPHSRPGYREFDGWWFPAAAFATDALITGAIRKEPRASSHAAWCREHYASYRASDNTYQPSRGPRRACVSPAG